MKGEKKNCRESLKFISAFKPFLAVCVRDDSECRTPGQGRKEESERGAEPGQRTQTAGALTQLHYPELPCTTTRNTCINKR